MEVSLDHATDSLIHHPQLKVARGKVAVAEAVVRDSKAQFLPKLQGQYGRQQVGGRSGFYQYQVGFSLPLFFGRELGLAQSAKINKEIQSQELKRTELELNTDYQIKREQYQKWINSWKYYKNQALPLASEQGDGAVLAYKEGAIDYVTFLQNIRDAIRVEIDAWAAFGNYLESRYGLEYYLDSNF